MAPDSSFPDLLLRARGFATRRDCLGLLLALPALPALAQTYQALEWDELVPDNWDPSQSFRDMQHLGNLPDTDPKVQKLYERMREVWDKAPVVAKMSGRLVKLPGYVVPLDSSPQGLQQFLLVPYFGACIHTPPPPANQIIHVRSAKPVKNLKTMSAVWVSGRLSTVRTDSSMGVSGYQMEAARIEPYKSPGR